MTRKKTVVAILSAVLLVAMAVCTFASIRIYRQLLPQVETVPIERRAVYLTLELEGELTSTENGRRIVCIAAWDEASQLPGSCRGQILHGDQKYTATVVQTRQKGDAAAIELTVPYQVQELPDGTQMSISIMLDGGVFDYVLPADCIYEGSEGFYLLTVREVEGSAGPELRVEEFLLDAVEFTNGVFTAFRTTHSNDLPSEAVCWSSEPISAGSAAKWREQE